MEEKRRRRTSNPELATRYQLEQVVEDFSLDGCVFADQSGALLNASDDQNSDWYSQIAKASPRLAIGSKCRLLFSKLSKHRNLRPNQISSCAFKFQGETFYVTTVGSMSTMRDVGMYRAILGIRRIFSETRAA